MPEAKRNERLLLAAVFLFWFSVYTYPSFLTDYAVHGLGATKVMAGMIVGSYGFTQMVLRIPLGNQKKLLIGCHALLQRSHAFGSAHIKMQHHLREDNQPLQWNDRKLIVFHSWHFLLLLRFR